MIDLLWPSIGLMLTACLLIAIVVLAHRSQP
jgi:hypothetical protein